MKQYTITYRTYRGALRFAVISAYSVTDANNKIQLMSPGAIVLTQRENNPKLVTVTECKEKA